MSACESCNGLVASALQAVTCEKLGLMRMLGCCAAPGNPLDALIGSSASPGSQLNSSVIMERAAPGLAQNYATAGQHSFDNLQGTSVGRSAQPQVQIHCSHRLCWHPLSGVHTGIRLCRLAAQVLCLGDGTAGRPAQLQVMKASLIAAASCHVPARTKKIKQAQIAC